MVAGTARGMPPAGSGDPGTEDFMRLENRVVAVSGAAGTIGRAVCFLLAEREPTRAPAVGHASAGALHRGGPSRREVTA